MAEGLPVSPGRPRLGHLGVPCSLEAVGSEPESERAADSFLLLAIRSGSAVAAEDLGSVLTLHLLGLQLPECGVGIRC